MTLSLAWAPLLPMTLLIVLSVLAATVAIAVLLARGPGAILRATALGVLVLALFNPSIRQEDRERLDGIVAVVLDTSSSQSLDQRAQQRETARQLLDERLNQLSGIDIRWIEAGSGQQNDGTALFEALEAGLSDVPSERISAIVMVTDGQVHDVPESADALGIDAPVHVLLTGRDDERDRRVVVENPPRFAIVGDQKPVQFQVIETDPASTAPFAVTIRLNGETAAVMQVVPGQTVDLDLEIQRSGQNLVEIEAEPLENELSLANNRMVFDIEGIRENLRVLLVSGEPHAGERTWRNILKSDAAVDLVHFTILRPPEKQDGTPISQLSLIAFPTRELFHEKIDEFDLIIFDRYQRRGVLPTLYFDNIASYVRDGGALLVSAGPDYAEAGSLYQTALSRVLPAIPTGRVIEEAFRPRLSDDGARHPITADLTGGRSNPPGWSQWFRVVESNVDRGDVLMRGTGNNNPLLVTSREGEGRVALMLSDQTWLWARGYDGGGPYVGLLRNLAHWLMKEYALEEEALSARYTNGSLTVSRRSMDEVDAPVLITGPDGQVQSVELNETAPGIFSGQLAIDDTENSGLYQLSQGDLTSFASVGPLDPRELSEVVRTASLLKPLVEQASGGVFELGMPDDLNLPRIMPIRSGRNYAGSDWMGIRPSEASVLRGVIAYPLMGGLLGLALLLSIIAATWYREGR